MVATAVAPVSLIASTAAAFGTPHSPIYIDGDADFAAQAFAEGWLGDGTAVDPYIIADYDIEMYDYDLSIFVDGITIKNTSVNFTISSCYTYTVWGYGNMVNTGVLLKNVVNGTVTGVISQFNADGIKVISSKNIAIIGGAVDPISYYYPDYSYNLNKGIYVYDCDFVDISSVTSWGCYYNMYVVASSNVTITGGYQQYAISDGIYVGGCTDVLIQSLFVTDNICNGIDVRTSTNVEIAEIWAGPNFWNGIYLSKDTNVLVWGTIGDDITPSTLLLHDNYYNGIYASNCVDLTIQGGDFGGYFDPYGYGYSYPCSNFRSGIYLIGCTNPVIQDSIATCNYNYYNGMMIIGCNNATLVDCSSNNNLGSSGFYLSNCNGVEMTGCNALANDYNGVLIKGGKNLSISGCTFTGNLMNGVYGSGAKNLTMEDCDVSSNTQSGMYMISCIAPTNFNSITSDGNGWNGIHLVACPSAAILGGSMSTNGWNGIYLKSSTGITIDGGTVADGNTFTGIYAALCTDLSVANSDFSSNGRDGISFASCQSPDVSSCTSNGNVWWGVRSLGCTLVSIIGCDLTGNSYGEMYWPNANPVAIFTVNRIEYINSPTVFNASTSYDWEGAIVSYDWEWGDGTTNSVGIPITTHQYAGMENYVVNLTVTDGTSKISPVFSKQLAIQTEICAKIVMPDRATVNHDVDLSGAKSFDFNGARTISAYEWDFDDGGPLGSGVSPVHAWTVEGTYDVGLRVQDDLSRWSPVVHSRIIIGTDAVVALSVGMSRHSLLLNEPATLTIIAVDGAGKKVASCTDTIEVNANRSNLGWTGLPATVSLIGGETSIAVSCSNMASYNITAEVQGVPSICGWEFATIATQTVETVVYDLGQFTLGSLADTTLWPTPSDGCGPYAHSYWNPTYRGIWGDAPFRYQAMAYNLYSTGADKLASNVDTTCRVNVEARNISQIDMTDPTFFPRMNAGPGGNMSFSWSWEYLNYSEFWYWNYQPDPALRHPKNPFTWSPEDQFNFYFDPQYFRYSIGASAYDGWETIMDISVTMDRDAAWQLIGLPVSDPDPLLWWDRYAPGAGSNNDTVRAFWEGNFMINEGGGAVVAGRLDIRSCDDNFAWEQGFWGSMDYRFYDNGDGTYTMTIKRCGYGEDTLMARWLYWGGVKNGWNYPNGTPNGILPFEMYYDDFHMFGNMNNDTANLAIDTGMIYAFRAQKSADPDIPPETAVWRFEHVRVDYAGADGSGLWNRSEMDLWDKNTSKGVRFEVWDPAGTAWGISIMPDQTPNIMRFDVGESFIMERPRTVVSGILPGPLVGDATAFTDRQGSGYNNWILINEKYGNATIHPLGCPTGSAVIDKGTGDMAIVGPFVPIIQYYNIPGHPELNWLWSQSAPLIEYWIQ